MKLTIARILAPFVAALHEQGIEVAMSTPQCQAWVASHRGAGGCHGCESEEGCDMLAQIAFLWIHRLITSSGNAGLPADHIDDDTWSRAMAIIRKQSPRTEVPDVFRTAFET